MVTDWGCGAKSSGGKVALSAMSEYGLLADEGRGDTRTLKLSDRALRILRLTDQGHAEERAVHVREAALAPTVHRDVIRRWPDALPSDAVIGSWLELDRGFYRNSMPDVLRVFRDALAYAGLDKGARIELPLEDESPDEDEEPMTTEALPEVDPGTLRGFSAEQRLHLQQVASQGQRHAQRSGAAALSVDLGGGMIVTIAIPSPMTLDTIDRMKRVGDALRPFMVRDQPRDEPAV